MGILEEIADGRTDLVFDYLSEGHPATSAGKDGVSLLRWCAYYGDVSAIKFLLSIGASLAELGENFDLGSASFHGHWRLCQFLLQRGADPNHASPDTGETPLHAALCHSNRLGRNLVVKVLLARGANPNVRTRPGVETGSFMRDCRTKGETPLHRAAAFGDEEAVQMLLDAGAALDAKDANGDSPLSWASWYGRPAAILRQLCYGDYRVHPRHRAMDRNLQGDPHSE
ncbi:MAG TPA: ankyrin repeat domain-containing protein [Candidatus Acidoferrum sp.]|nr:ankyrin repeat domain-containing protein [Candidatus Acidoferrum sp.]